MISQLRPIETRDFQIPTTTSPFSFESFSFLFFNIISLGVYGTIQSLAKDHKIKELHLKQQHLQAQAARIFGQFDRLNAEIHEIRRRLNRDETGEAVAAAIDNLELRVIDVANLTELDHQITQVATPFIQLVGILLSNIVTGGLYGMFQNSNQNSRLATLEAHNEQIKEVVEEKRQAHATSIESQLNTLRVNLRISQEKKEVMQSEVGQAFFGKKEAERNASRLEQEKEELTQRLTSLEANEAHLRRNQLQLNESIVQRGNELEAAKQRNAELRSERARELNGMSISQLRMEAQQLGEEATRVQSAFNKEQSLNLELTGLRQVSLNDVQRAHLELGPIPLKCPGSGEIAGDYGLGVEDGEEERWTDYTKRYAGKKTAAELMHTSLEFAFDDLIEMAKKDNPKINWNASASIWYDTEGKYTENKSALYRHMVWDFISHSSLIQVDQHSYALRLNNEGVTMASSMPVRCMKGVRETRVESEVEGRKVVETQREVEVCVLPTIIDDFTPAIGDLSLPFGIDPLSAKRIFAQLSEDEKGHLQNLLLDPLIAHEHPDLQGTKAFMRSGASGRVKLVQNAYELICDIALAIEKNFANKGLGQTLGGKADDYDLEPFHKEEVQAPIVDQPVQPANPIVEWTPDLEALKVKTSNRFSPYSQEDFATTIQGSVSMYKTIYAGMSKKVIDNPNNILYTSSTSDQQLGNLEIKGLLNQFIYKHPMYNSHGCLMSAMTSILMTDTSKAHGSTTQKLKNAMAAYLDVKENADRFANKIAANHSRTSRPVQGRMTAEEYEPILEQWLQKNVKDYQSWLLNGGLISTSNLGDVEIELVANLIGVRIAVFYPGQPTKLNEFGLTVPADERFYYGPNTKETLYLYNSTGCTYAGLWPKMKTNEFASEEMKTAARSLSTYVTTFSTS
ncbi:Conserved hypothetical membrane protein [Candidatus Protochlamydia naegleriophila]|uniref:Conserved hypothetical membrane protein n=1 Tax=Candidatus Protochlamydia naegleriophila TaxID=389348 RepID=A0A0U5JAL9_9BACT|nr:hypothetical protein [Candidatus Protochlamydia naegleriophila]CUI16478.1 Conserved hypothetical membrane protein [Candidatus Protochlamydia naegleriophila]